MNIESPYRTRTEMIRKALLQAVILSILAAFLGLGTNHFRTDGIPLIADWSPAARLKTATGDSRLIPPDEAAIFYTTREAVFIDARSPKAFESGHIPGALNIPWTEADQTIDKLLNDFPNPDTIIITYCEGKTCSQSGDLALMLLEIGYPNVKVLENGWYGWIAAGYPSERIGKTITGEE